MGTVSPGMRVAGVILCGGQSRRMGCDKAWLPFGTQRMLPLVAGILREAVGPVCVVAGPGQILPPLPDAVVIAYDPQPGKGPLQGLATGLAAVKGWADAVFLAPCDTPLLRPAFVRDLLGRLGDADIALPREGEYYHPMSAVYRTSVLGPADALLAAGTRRIDAVCGVCPTVEVSVESLRQSDPDLRSLLNINGPDDYRKAAELAGICIDRGQG